MKTHRIEKGNTGLTVQRTKNSFPFISYIFVYNFGVLVSVIMYRVPWLLVYFRCCLLGYVMNRWMNRSYLKPARTIRSPSSCILIGFNHGAMAWKHFPLNIPLQTHTASHVFLCLSCYSMSIHVYICYTILHSSMNPCHFPSFAESYSICFIYLKLKPVGISMIIRILNKIRYLSCVDFMFAYITRRGGMLTGRYYWASILSCGQVSATHLKIGYP